MSLDDIEKLKRNNQELQEIINNSWDGIGIIDKNAKFIYVNNAFMPILGFFKDELINKSFIDFMEKRFIENFLNLLDIEKSAKKYQAEIDIVCIRKDLKKVYLKVTISSMLNKNLFVINTKDITSQISDDEILDDYIISMYTDLHGHITKVSSAFLKLTAYEKKDIIGKPFISLAHKDSDLIVYKNINKSLENLQEWSGNLKKTKANGEAFWINIKIKPRFNKYGDVIGYTSFMLDISKEVSLNDEARILQEQVSLAKDEINKKDDLLIQQSKMAIVSETLQKLSHEWRQPLNLISIKAQKLELDYELNDKLDAKKTITTLEEIKSQADNLSSTIEKFQKYLEPKNEKEEYRVSTLLNKILDEFKKEHEDLEINLEIKDDISYETYYDEMKTILFNLFINSKEAFLRKNISLKSIRIKQYVINDTIYFEISDKAQGIKEDKIHKIFEPYFSTKEIKHGVGLGLYTSKLIVNTMFDGIITAQNIKNGVCIKISIPIK